METLIKKTELSIKKKEKYAGIVVLFGALAILFSFINWLLLSLVTNWIFVPSIIVGIVGVYMSSELSLVKEEEVK